MKPEDMQDLWITKPEPYTPPSMWRRAAKWLGWSAELIAIGVAGAAIISLIIFCGWAVVSDESDKQAAFIAECRHDHKAYECEALWRQGENHTSVVPLPIFINSGH